MTQSVASRALLDLEPLDDNQLALLHMLWSPFRHEDGPWPFWGWVREQFEIARPGFSALRTLASLPTLRPAYPNHPPYRLVWQNDGHNADPRYDEQVGLSIAGMIYLSRDKPGFGEAVVDRYVGVLRDIGFKERRRAFTPISIPSARHPFEMFVGDLPQRSLRKRFSMSIEDVALVIRREYGFPVALSKQGDEWVVPFEGAHRMEAEYSGLMTGDDYIRLLVRLDRSAHEDSPVVASMLPPNLYDSGSSDEPEWRRIDSLVRGLTVKIEASTTVEQWKEVGLAATELLIEVAKLVQNPAYLPMGVEPPKAGDAKQWIWYFLLDRGVRDEMRGFIAKTWELAQNVKHGTDLSATDAFAAAQATVAIVRTVQRAGQA